MARRSALPLAPATPFAPSPAKMPPRFPYCRICALPTNKVRLRALFCSLVHNSTVGPRRSAAAPPHRDGGGHVAPAAGAAQWCRIPAASRCCVATANEWPSALPLLAQRLALTARSGACRAGLSGRGTLLKGRGVLLPSKGRCGLVGAGGQQSSGDLVASAGKRASGRACTGAFEGHSIIISTSRKHYNNAGRVARRRSKNKNGPHKRRSVDCTIIGGWGRQTGKEATRYSHSAGLRDSSRLIVIMCKRRTRRGGGCQSWVVGWCTGISTSMVSFR